VKSRCRFLESKKNEQAAALRDIQSQHEILKRECADIIKKCEEYCERVPVTLSRQKLEREVRQLTERIKEKQQE